MLDETRRPTGLVATILIALILLALASCGQPNDDPLSSAATSLILPVYADGFHRLSFDALTKAGLDMSRLPDWSNGSQLPRLSHGRNVVPILQMDDAFIFYGQAPTERYAQYRPYVLEVEGSGVAMYSEKLPAAALEPVAAVPFILTFEENNFYDGRPYEGHPSDPALRDPWYWETIQVEGQAALEFDLPRQPLRAATLELDLVGVSSNGRIADDHDLDVIVNNRHLQTVRWDGATAVTLSAKVPEGLLQEGANTLVLDNAAPGAAPIDITRLDRFRVSYLAAPSAVDGQLHTAGVEGAVALTGFRDRPLLFDIRQPDSPVVLSGSEYSDDQTIVALDKEIELYAVSPESLLQPGGLVARGPAELTNTAIQADFIIISPSALLPALQPLADHRQAQGISTKLVPLERIYEEFAADGVGPAAITAFLRHAYNNWMTPRPAYLLLVGDATIDYRDYLDQDLQMLLPSPVVPVNFSGETVSDARLTDIDGDRRPDMAVGRWPVSTVDDVEAVVKRTIDNERAEPMPSAIFAADGSELRFADLNRAISQQAGLASDQVHYLDGPVGDDIRQSWEQGAWLVTYTGHGSLDRWGKQSLLDTESVSLLEGDGARPIVLQLTCLTGLFAHPTITSLSEEMLLDENGPVSIVAATSLTLSDDQRPFGIAFLQALQDPAFERVGDAFQWAKVQLDIDSYEAMREISDTFTLIGDPTALIGRPEQH